MLIDLDSIPKGHQGVVAAACRVSGHVVAADSIKFHADGIAQSPAVICIALNAPPRSVELAGKPLDPGSYDFADGILRIRFTNSTRAQEVMVHQ